MHLPQLIKSKKVSKQVFYCSQCLQVPEGGLVIMATVA